MKDPEIWLRWQGSGATERPSRGLLARVTEAERLSLALLPADAFGEIEVPANLATRLKVFGAPQLPNTVFLEI